MWGILQNKDNLPGEKASLDEKMAFLSKAYAEGDKKYKESEDAKSKIRSISKKIYEHSDREINFFYEKGKKWSLQHFDQIYKKLGTKFDYLILETQVAEKGKKIVERGLSRGIFEKGENGATIFRGDKSGLHTRVFINSEGFPTYEGKDLGLAQFKYEKFPYDLSFIVTANEQKEYFEVMLMAMELALPNLAQKTKHIGHGAIRLPEGKMTSRAGNVVTGESLIEKVKELVEEKIKDKGLSDEEKKEISEKVAVGAIKYSILKQSIGSDIIYDFDKSISFEGDSGPYLQYAYTRAQSVLRKAKDEGMKPSFKKIPTEITQLEKTMSYFPETVLRASKGYEPHFLVLYLTELAATFNAYYAENRIIDKSDEFSSYKVALTAAFAEIMKNGLWLLGIETLEKM
jgi:arginyl-tRNA synthetase